MGSYKGRGPQTDKISAAKSLQVNFLKITTFGIAFYQSNLSTPWPLKVPPANFQILFSKLDENIIQLAPWMN
jgi:hypothetical protein